MLIDKKHLEKKLCQLNFIPTVIVCVFISLIFIERYLDHARNENFVQLKKYAALFNNINIESAQTFNTIADNILSSNSYYSITLLNDNAQHVFTRGVSSNLSQLDLTDPEKSLQVFDDKITYFSHIAYIDGTTPQTGRILITKNHQVDDLWYYRSVLYFLGIVLGSALLILFFIYRLQKTLLNWIAPISNGIDQLKEENFEHIIQVDKQNIFHPFAYRINQLSLALRDSRKELQHTIDQSLVDLKESLETVEIQNIEIDLARKNALKANKTTSEFLANTSHEIRTPINGIIGFANLLRKTPISDKQSEYIDTIEESAKALLININDIIDYSRLAIGKLNLDYKPVNIREIIKDSLRYAIAHHPSRDIEFDCHISEATPDKLLGDSMRIKQVCSNLMNCAIDLSDNHVFSSDVDIDDRGDNKVTLKTSINIPGKHQNNSRIEEAQQTLSSKSSESDTLQSKHLMSLMIAKGLVRRMDGHIGLVVDNDEATLWFSVELGRPDYQVEAIESKDFNIFLVPHILVVDDNPANSRLVREILRELAVSVDTADSGEEAIKMCADQRYSMILMDIQMPGLNGYDTTREIRAQETSSFRTPIIALTAHAVEDEKAKMLISGMDDFVSKPVGETELRELFHRWLKYSPRQIDEAIKPAQKPAPEKARENLSERTKTTESQIPHDSQPVNIASSVELAKGNRELAKDMLAMLLTSLKNETEDIKRFWQEKNYDDLYEVVHRIHGGACYCGVPQLLEASAKLDKNLKDKNYDNCNTEIPALLESCEQLLAWEEEHDLTLLFSD